MDRTISIIAASLILCLPLGAAQDAGGKAQAQAKELKGTIRVPAGAAVDTSAPIEVELRLKDGGRVRGTFRGEGTAGGQKAGGGTAPERGVEAKRQAAQPGKAPQPESNPAPPPGLPVWLWVAGSVVVTGSVIAAALWYYFRRVIPGRELDPYWRALEMIRVAQYERALPDLTVVESKLPAHLREDARFFIALCHYHIGEESEAEHLAASLQRERPGNENAAYLLAYIRVKRGLDADAEPVLRQLLRDGHRQLQDTRKMLGIVCFRQGMSAMRSGEIERATELFAEVEELEDWREHIPPDLQNQHVSLGTKALFGRDAAKAQEQFLALDRAAAEAPEDRGRILRAKAKVGLALAAWIADDSAGFPALEEALLLACRTLYPQGAEELPWPDAVAGSAKGDAESLRRALEAADRDFNLPPEEKSTRRCLRDLHLVRAMGALRCWAREKGKLEESAIERHLKTVLDRLACSRALDEQFADTYLVAGLLMFYLHQPGPQRTTGVDLLEEAKKLGVRDPDAMVILANRARIEQASADALDRYHMALDQYLRDETVRCEVRVALLNRLTTHRSLMNRFKPPDLSRARSVPPTVEEMCRRSDTLREHMRLISRRRSNPELASRGEDLKRQGEEIRKQMKTLEETESDLLVMTGEELFKDV